MFPKDKQEMKILDENLGELDATVKHLENEIFMKKKQFFSQTDLKPVDISQVSEINNQEMIKSPIKETRIVPKSELDNENADSSKDEFQINENLENENFIPEEYIQNDDGVKKAISTNISPKNSVIIDQNTESSFSYSNVCESSTNLKLIHEKEEIPLDLQSSIPIQLQQPPQIPILQPQPNSQPHINPFMIQPMQMPPHAHGGVQLKPIPIHKQSHDHFHLAPQATAFQPGQSQVHLNPRIQSIPGMIQSQHPFPLHPHHNAPMPPVPSTNMQIPLPVPMQMPIPVPIPMQMSVPVQVPMQVPMQGPMQVPMQAPMQVPLQAPIQIPMKAPMQVPLQAPALGSMQIPNMNSPYLLTDSNMQIQLDPTAPNSVGTPPPNMGPPSHIQTPISSEIAPGFPSGITGSVGVTGSFPAAGSGPNIPNPLGMDSQMLAKYLLTAMAEECLNKKKSTKVEDGNLASKNQTYVSESGPSSVSSTLFPAPNIRPLIQPPKVEIDFNSPTCFSQDVFKKKCKRKPKVTSNNSIPKIDGQFLFSDQNPMVNNHGLNPELEANPDQQSQISPPSSPTCFSFKASVPVSILGDNPFSESITKMVTNKVSQCHPHQYMPNSSFNIKSGYNLPIHLQ
ncbi:uncharacterized protein cubi_03435 [Cryptosporidium ubiquitum]|uniref:Uncharacterized protein n=1 Tax=Cryptosporidium ubiquitum TaxID=857276 RepID=A0A1J4ML85_9CRYT|nr:uncharacterized protein cubi_03435 [Cryptosporidium ubiquitum]OII73637.1 hypothetical protein cubi_03435 [Cryptosporidium ubiquitum]